MPVKKRLSRLFIKTFLISLAAFAVVISAAWLTLRNMNPPEVNASAEYEPPVIDNMDNEAAYIIPKGEPEDALIIGSRPSYVAEVPNVRKDLFYTFLLFGLDAGVNTDAIMVASYDGVAKEAHIINIPRDIKVNVKRKIKKINAAYPIGILNGGGHDGGVNQLKRELKTLIGFSPDYYISVDFKAFIRLVDAVGGVEVDVPFHMFYEDEIQDLFIDIPKGRQILNGKDALRFARYRRGNKGFPTITDYQRIENQQQVINAMLKNLLTPASIFKLPEFVGIFTDNVSTDIKFREMIWFADQLNEIRGTDALNMHTLPTTGTSGAPDWYELPDEAAILELINQTINPYKNNLTAYDLNLAE